MENGHEWVDLGLSVKWATCNVGAVLPGDYSDYFAWGETSKKSEYSWETYRWTDKEFYELIKYCPSDKYDYWVDSGNPDNITQLDMSDDAARQNWGGSWHIPTEKEWTELCEKCDWTWSAQDGHEGYRVSSKKTALTMDGMLNSI
ncbi:MAG: hypothetical protein IJ151_04175 [Bacteroidales bacterium]|nr:hypothetical protein [Bacteroidales bacterium]